MIPSLRRAAIARPPLVDDGAPRRQGAYRARSVPPRLAPPRRWCILAAAMERDEQDRMPAYTKILVADAERAAGFYELLGFTRVHQDPVFVHLRWARGADLFLVATPPGVSLAGQRGLGVILCFDVSSGDVALETIAARAAAAGATVDGPRDQPWHTREVLITDLDGYRVAFVEPSATPLF
jgi:catechol 2,3-dioxygenase-like lactoylglutathione lyase family enzyme